MKRIVLCILLSAGLPCHGAVPAAIRADTLSPSLGRDSLSAVFWNLENFFDWRNDSTSVSDAEFSSRGARHWTRKRFEAKCNAIAKTMLWTASETGRLPDVVGFAEVENSFVLKRLLRGTLLRKLDYKFVHFDSPDRRGIDVALLYRESVLELIDAKPCHLYDTVKAASSGVDSCRIMPTRDILLCRFRLKDHPGGNGEDAAGGEFAVFVNHHPSKYGGAAVSDARRRAAVGRLRFLADSLSAAGTGRILAFGDFNDTPDNPIFSSLEPALMPLYSNCVRRGEGTIRFDGRWELIDLAFASPGQVVQLHHSAAPPNPEPVPSPERWAGPMRILRPPFLRTRDTVHGGWKPLRTYSGPRYLGGVSDHCPILVHLAPP